LGSGRTANMSQRVPEGEYFVFGDNRDHSSDSREIGPIPINYFQGRVILVLFPLKDVRTPVAPRYVNEYNNQLSQGAIKSY